MADGKRPRDEESSAEPHGLPRVCHEYFRGRVPSSGPGAWIAGRGGDGPSGGPGVSESSLSGGPPARGDIGASAAAAGGSASSSVAPPAPVVAAPSVAPAEAPGLPAPGLLMPGSPAASAASSESDSGEVNPDIVALQRECDLARGRFSFTVAKIEHLRDSLQAVEVAQGAAEEEVRAARDAAADAVDAL
ncbi:dihydrolipoyllysine-residue acetyltransferase component of pyruvate dehydrogenase complex-like [Panicum virgatum]|uniref:dihydrolipoyllysine-residue acetyltransferase component of pyruvate dehydrogenase complex-like n=1 Tax=Panicum virgatum TaxID=38727 RepID=UPI0019D586C7|nr:dihydrolipoyllysine-residue acetyltransferase component of pyruvate dehydrogenase complex-like [Panicum virgatum]